MKGTKNGARGRAMAVAGISAALLVPLATFGAPALARSGAALAEYAYGSGSGQYQYKVKVCHVTHGKKKHAHTITVSSKAVRAHLRHGDHLGACTGTETRPAKHNEQGKNGKDNGKHGSAPVAPTTGKDHKKGK